MSTPTLTAAEAAPVNGYDTRDWTDRWLAEDTLAEIRAWAELPLRHPDTVYSDAEILDRIREQMWARRAEIRDRQAVRAELRAMALGGAS